MVICFDVRAVQIGHEHRGIGMFIKSVLENLPPDNNDYIFYAFSGDNPIEKMGINFKNSYSVIQTPIVATAISRPRDIINFLRLSQHSFNRLRAVKPDVFVQFDFQLGLPKWHGITKVVVAYDLIPIIKKREYLPGTRFAWQHSIGKKAKLKSVARSLYYKLKYHLGYRVYVNADKVLAISQATAESFNKLLKIPSRKISIMRLAAVTTKSKGTFLPTNIGNKPFIFYIGGTDSRKRIIDIVRAFNIVKGRGHDIALVLAGNEFEAIYTLPDVVARNAIMASPYKGDIHLIGFVSDSAKMTLYSAAHAFVFCSTYEGFGLPIVEAMSAGCPVVSYNNSSIPETAGKAALLVDTGDYVGVANTIIKLFDTELRHKLVEQGLKQADEFNWHDTARVLLKTLSSF